MQLYNNTKRVIIQRRSSSRNLLFHYTVSKNSCGNIKIKKVLQMGFAERLQELREDRGISRKDLAAKLNITVSALGMYEQGRREPNMEMLIKLADYFDVSLDFLVGRSFNKEETSKIIEALHLKKEIDKLSQEYRSILVFMLSKT